MSDDEDVPVERFIAQADIAPFEAQELDGAAVIDAVVIVRYQRPEWQHPRTAYQASRSMPDELRIGILTLVLDQVRRTAGENWEDD